MHTLETLKRQIHTAEELHSVVKTMKALAAVNIRQLERAVESLADYNRTNELGFRVLLQRQPETALSARLAPRSKFGTIVFGSDQGMCGQLNDQITMYAMDQMNQTDPEIEQRIVLAVGARPASRLEDGHQKVEAIYPVPSSTASITSMVQQVLLHIERWHAHQGIGRIRLFYCEHETRVTYRPTTVELLPIDRQWLQNIQQQEWPTHALPMFSMPPNELFSALVRQYLFVKLYRAFAESMASENASRLASMHGAERNITDRIAALNTKFHQQRQMTITEELLDIAAGFEALSEASCHQ